MQKDQSSSARCAELTDIAVVSIGVCNSGNVGDTSPSNEAVHGANSAEGAQQADCQGGRLSVARACCVEVCVLSLQPYKGCSPCHHLVTGLFGSHLHAETLLCSISPDIASP